jgi:hypothetical protein
MDPQKTEIVLNMLDHCFENYPNYDDARIENIWEKLKFGLQYKKYQNKINLC